MRKIRISIAGLMGVVVVAALGFAALRNSSEAWAGLMLMVTCGMLMLGVVGAVCRGPGERARWLGFALFGGGYLALAHVMAVYPWPLPTIELVEFIGSHMGRKLTGRDWGSDGWNDLLALPPDVRIAHDAWALAFAVIGSALAGVLFKDFSARALDNTHEGSKCEDEDTAGWWRGQAIIGLLGFGLVAVAAVLAGRNWEPESWAGAAFLLTWLLVGVAILGAVCARGNWREAWGGAASFGIGYLIFAFGPVVTMNLPTNHFLNAVFRAGGPTRVQERFGDDLANDDESQRVRRALREPIAVHFPAQTPLQTVLDHIKSAIRGPLGKELVVYAGRELGYDFPRVVRRSVVRIDRANIPADEALRVCLSQLGLTYRVQSGYVRIIPDAYEPPSFAEDPVMIAGHSLLALVVAALGALAAPLVARICGRARTGFR